MSMIYFPAVIIVQHYFTRKRSIAVAFANAGTPFGASMYPPLVSYLISEFGWRWELAIVCAITLNGLVFSSFFKPVSSKKKPAKQIAQKTEKKAQDIGASERSVSEVILSSVLSLGQASLTEKERSKLSTFFANLTDFSLWRNPNMVLDVLAYGLFSFGFILPSMFLPLKTQKYGIPHPEILLSITGFSDVIGRLTSGLVGTFLGRRRLVVYGIGMAVCGSSAVVSSFFETFPPLAGYAVVFGLCTGMSRAYSSVVVTDTLGIENLPKAYGFKMCLCGIGVLTSGPLTG